MTKTPGPEQYPLPIGKSPTSVEAHERIVPDKHTLRGMVYEALQRADSTGMTRHELTIHLELPIQTICPRVWELLNREVAGELAPLIEEGPDKRKTSSGRWAYVLRVRKAGLE